MKRAMTAFFACGVGSFYLLSQVSERFRPPHWGLWLLIIPATIACIAAAATFGGGQQRRRVSSKPTQVGATITREQSNDADRLWSVLAANQSTSFTEEELTRRLNLRGVNLTAAISELGDRIEKGTRNNQTTYKLKRK